MKLYKKICITITALMLAYPALNAQEPLKLPVWPNGPAEENGITENEYIAESGNLKNAKTAEIFVYLPPKEKNTGAAVLICPGGGYGNHAINHEGHRFARILNEKGIAGIVLKYRLPNGHYNIPLSDASEAMKIIRNHAAEWGIDPHKTGVSGFSAGGHLASTLATHFDEQTRPDFAILYYPVITMEDDFTHKGSKNNLLGKESGNRELVEKFSNEMQVTPQTPPTLIFLSDDDKTVLPQNSTQFYNALKKNNIKAAMHIFPSGKHGWGCNDKFAYKDIWQSLLFNWLKEQNVI